MDKFLGLQPPPSKKLKDTKASNKKYDLEKRERSFQACWSSQFDWLLYSSVEKKMYCRPCRSVYGPLALKNKAQSSKFSGDKFDKYMRGPLVQGSDNFKKHALVVHDQSDGHKDAVKKFWAKTQAKPGESEAEKCLLSLNKADMTRLDLLFRNAHAIAVNSRPFSDFQWMAKLDEKKGLPVGKTYRNDKQCSSFIKSISAVERAKISDEIKDAKFLSVLTDGSTDVATIENEVIYARACTGGKVHVYFLEMHAVKRANAQGIFSSIKLALNSYDENAENKLVGFACDGASVNVGSSSGVIALMHDKISHSIVLIHCLNHRIELAFKDAVKGQKLYAKVDGMLAELYKFYHTSALQTENLKSTFEACGMTVQLPHRVGGTRWVSHLVGALGQVWKGYKAFYLHLSQVNLSDYYSCLQV